MRDGELIPVPEWASPVLRRTWDALDAADQLALIADHENSALRAAANSLRRTASAHDFAARPGGDFTLDGLAYQDTRWHARWFEEPWNGWACPVVTRQTLDNLINDLTLLNNSVPGCVDAAGVLTMYRDPGNDGEHTVVEPDDAGLYHLYDLGWCFISLS
jgi:hypothetical protein